ncbi:MAG: type I restriction endonuclease subunit S [Alphaproteobacteria bacterium]|nr:MAG: type I restriction endonuclease subunit S [Alphaproteobacteria bacterium]
MIADLCPKGVKSSKFGDLATIVRGASPRPIQSFVTSDPDGVNWIKIGDVPPGGKYITYTKEKITKEGAEKSRYVNKGDFVLSNSMSFGRPYIMKITGCIHDGWLAISDFDKAYMSDFLYYLLSSSIVQRMMAQRASSGTVQNLNADIVKSLDLPVPPLEIQREIVKILDTFTALEAELEAELEARRRQYSYYRDALLAFDDADIDSAASKQA